jgi:hypothetical protein
MPTKEAVIQYLKDSQELNFKSANYLFVAHGAGVIGCLSVIKDYASASQLHGIGSLIVIFSVGFLAGVLNYVSLVLSRAVVFGAILDDKPYDGPTAKFLSLVHVISLAASIIALVAALILVIERFYSL